MKAMIRYLCLSVSLMAAPMALSQEKTPIQEDAQFQKAMDTWAEQDPDSYEQYRQLRVKNARDYDEFLQWATPDEIQQDMPDEANQSLPVMNAGGALVSVHVTLNAKQQGTITLTTPEGTFQDSALGARKGYEKFTPRGCSTPWYTERMHYSSVYNNAPMPFSTFYRFKSGAALHGGSLEQGSHGCIHLATATAKKVYDAVNKYGRANTVVCVD